LGQVVVGVSAAALLLVLSSATGLHGCSAASDNAVQTERTHGGTADDTEEQLCQTSCPEGTVCDPDTGECVGCITGDDCAEGQYCDTVTQQCEDGCADDSECPDQLCDPDTHECVDCTEDDQCEPGSVCGPDGTCVPGCSETQFCPAGLQCCTGACLDTQTDLANCGACGEACPGIDNATVVCAAGVCEFDMCDDGYADCNLNHDDGCEHNLSLGDCACTPGDKIPCYGGPLGTEGVGECKAGEAECTPDGQGYGVCLGQTLPAFDVCGDGLDNDCTGGSDDAPDIDGDGWGPCDGDCCEITSDCAQPILVNPGAFEVDGNTIDDDCDGTTDNVPPTCDAALTSNTSAAMDYALALDLCTQTDENPAKLEDKTWGVISSEFFRADGAGTPAANQKSIRPGYGTAVTPLQGDSLAVMSTGVAAAEAAPSNTSPSYSEFQGGQSMGTTSGVPADWLAANNNNFPNTPGCPDPNGGTVANDPVMLKLRVRVPTNALSFSLSTFFYSSEYPEWVCSAFNDFFLALLDSSFMPGMGQEPNPTDKNLAVYNDTYPVGVNLAFGNTGLFSQCLNGPTGCGSSSVAGDTTTCTGTGMLDGTGFDVADPDPQFGGDPGWCGSSNLSGGGTGWLTLTGNVEPGEIIELRFVTWDTGDGWYDSTVLLDNFVWSLEASEPGVKEKGN